MRAFAKEARGCCDLADRLANPREIHDQLGRAEKARAKCRPPACESGSRPEAVLDAMQGADGGAAGGAPGAAHDVHVAREYRRAGETTVAREVEEQLREITASARKVLDSLDKTPAE